MDPLDVLELEACRACLATDVKLYDILSTEFANLLEELTKTPVQYSDGLSHYVCYICKAKLRNYLEFRQNCRQAHIILQDIRAQELMVTKRRLNQWPHKKLTANYACSKPEVIFTLEPDDTISNIKSENNDFCNLSDTNDERDDYNDDDDTPIFYAETGTDMKIFASEKLPEINDYKVTGTVDDQIIPEAEIDSNFVEDFKVLVEPITSEITSDNKIVLKADLDDLSIKEEFITKKSKSKKVKSKAVKTKAPPIQKKKRKHLYNQKFEEDFEEFCKQCNVDVVFLTKEQQIQRVKQKATEGKYRMRCEKCFSGFMTESAYKKHMKMHDPSSGEFECDVCFWRYSTKEAIQRHMRLHKKEFVCKLCEKVLINSHRAKMHHLWHEGFKPECKHCHRKFNAQSSQMNHMREQHTLVSCQLCGEKLEGTIALGRHKNEQHSLCNSCNVQFKSYEAFTTHKEYGCNPNERSCAWCGAGAADDAGLRAHELELHRGHRTNRYKCDMCPSSFGSDRALGSHFSLAHARYHRPRDGSNVYTRDQLASSYLCELCARSFNSPIHLKTHQANVHSTDRPFKCSYCPKGFTDKNKLAVHINIHTGERPYKCKLCPEMFKSYAQRYKHKLLVHTKERPHKCRLCEKTYVLSNDLKWHIRYAHLHEPRPPRNRRRKKDPPAPESRNSSVAK